MCCGHAVIMSETVTLLCAPPRTRRRSRPQVASEPMSASPASPAGAAVSSPVSSVPQQATVLLYSDNITVRDSVRAAVGRRPARDVEVGEWLECATGPAVVEAIDAGGFDLAILDGEAAKTGGMALCRQLKSEVLDCPPVLVLTGRPQDGWLATWSLADGVVPHPLGPIVLADTVAELVRSGDVVRHGGASDEGRPGPHAS